MKDAGPVIIAAVARNGVIGKGGTLPWRIPEDLARFREITSAPGACVIMGRKTWESVPPQDGEKLPGRDVLVLSRNAATGSPEETGGAGSQPPHSRVPRFFRSFDAALEHARSLYRRVYIAGGESVYREALAFAGAMLITRVDSRPEGDRFFPLDLDNAAAGWHLQSEEPRRGYCFTVWKKCRERNNSPG